MKLLFLDTETAPSLGYFYGRFNQNIRPVQIVHTGFFLMYQYSIDDGPILVESLENKSLKLDRALMPDDDLELCMGLSKLIGECDAVVGHNMRKFDFARLQSRLAYHNLPPTAPIQIIDTLTIARSMGFEANSLDALCQALKIGNKLHSGGYETSIKCLMGDRAAWEDLTKYGIQDVVLLKELYYKLLPWDKRHPNVSFGDSCMKCGGKLHCRGYAYTKQGKYRRFRCYDCGSWFRDKKNLVRSLVTGITQ